MRVLLDTNVVIWLASDAKQLSVETVELLANDATELVLSSVVPWEVSIKWRTGKLTLPSHPREWSARLVRELGV